MPLVKLSLGSVSYCMTLLSPQHLLKSQNVCVYCGLGFFKPVLLQQHLISEHPNGAVPALTHSAYGGEQLELE